MINVTKPYLPPYEEYEKNIKRIWENNWLTNQGPILNEFETTIKSYLNVENFHFISNGTVALQLAIAALDIKGSEVITTPFSFVATTNSIIWENCTPVFVDIETDNFNIDVNKIEEKITPKTKAILAVHVFGYPCNVEKIKEIADKHNLKVIYDAAHAFACRYKGKSLLSYGDLSTCSFHATKVFHTVEGGGISVNNPVYNEKIDLLKKFGYEKENYKYVGINAKNSEFHAAMGVTVFPHLNEIIEKRKEISEKYDKELIGILGRPKVPDNFEYNYIYYPVLFKSEEDLLKVFDALHEKDIYPRRYFYPSLNTLPFSLDNTCPISEEISKKIACLPLDPYITDEVINEICNTVKNTLL